MPDITNTLKSLASRLEGLAERAEQAEVYAGDVESAASDIDSLATTARRAVEGLEAELGDLKDEVQGFADSFSESIALTVEEHDKQVKAIIDAMVENEELYTPARLRTEIEEAVDAATEEMYTQDSLDGYVREAVEQAIAEYEAELVQNAKQEDAEPVREAGIVQNVRYGFIPGEDDEHGPSLRCDVNCDGRWLLARLTGRQLGKFLKRNDLTDVQYLDGRVVELVSDEKLAWRIDRLVPEGEVKAQDAAVLSEMEKEAEQVTLAGPKEWRGAERFKVPVGARFVKPSSFEGERTIIRPAEGMDGFIDDTGEHWFGDAHNLQLVDPLTVDKYGHPVYPGDHVAFTDEMGRSASGVAHSDVNGIWAVARDDGSEGGGVDGRWTMDSATDIRKQVLTPEDAIAVLDVSPELTVIAATPEDASDIAEAFAELAEAVEESDDIPF